MSIEIKEVKSTSLNSDDVEEYNKLDFLFKKKKIERREFLRQLSVLSLGGVLVNYGVMQNKSEAFLFGVLARFFAGNLFRVTGGGAVRSIARSAVTSIGRGARSIVTPVRAGLKVIDESLDAANSVVNLAQLLNQDAVWHQNDVDNDASVVVTNYSNSKLTPVELNMYLRDIYSRDTDLQNKLMDAEIPPQSEYVMNFSVRDLPSTGIKRLEGDENTSPSGRIVVASEDHQKRGMTTEEIYRIYEQLHQKYRSK